MNDNKDNLISILDYANIIGIPKRNIYEKIKRGVIKAEKINGKWYIDKYTEYKDNRIKNGKYVDWRKHSIEINMNVINDNIIVENNDEYDIKVNEIENDNIKGKEYSIIIKKNKKDSL